MNFIQFGLFFIYIFSLLVTGIGIYSLLNPKNENYLNRPVFTGEVLLLGGTILVGEMLVLSLVGFYKAPFLWGAVLLNFAFSLKSRVREQFAFLLKQKVKMDFALVVFSVLLLVFVFRNLFFLVDIDSHFLYLYAQKLWLAKGSSLVGDVATDMRIWVPHMNAVPYALGLSLFPHETLFPQLIVVSWSLISLLLIFGYVSYRFNRYYGLGAVLLILLNDHFFYSGVNACCIINSTLVALLFAIVFNFWESRRSPGLFRFTMALIFLTQLLSNKYQMFYVTIFLLGLGLLVQDNPGKKISAFLKNKTYAGAVALGMVLCLLWYVRNYLMTGVPTFPIGADKIGVFNWTPAMASGFNRIFAAPLSPSQFLKYISFLLVWPGIDALKIVLLAVVFGPLTLILLGRRGEFNREQIREWAYWLTTSIFIVMGICMVTFVDPRHYRYGIAVFSFAAVLSIDLILKKTMNVRKDWMIAGLLILFALRHLPLMWAQGGSFKYPTINDNIQVLLNKMHFSDVIQRYYPQNIVVQNEYRLHPEQFEHKAWDTAIGSQLSSFLLPIRPQVGLWSTTVVKWDSYDHPELIVKDLKEYGIEGVMRVKGGKLIFLTPEEYAREAAAYDRYPKSIFYNYNFPQELTEIRR